MFKLRSLYPDTGPETSPFITLLCNVDIHHERRRRLRARVRVKGQQFDYYKG